VIYWKDKYDDIVIIIIIIIIIIMQGMTSQMRVVHRILVGSLRERDHWGDSDVDGRITLRWILKWEGVVGTGWSGLRRGTVGGHL
jgi:hypothetical protein